MYEELRMTRYLEGGGLALEFPAFFKDVAPGGVRTRVSFMQRVPAGAVGRHTSGPSSIMASWRHDINGINGIMVCLNVRMPVNRAIILPTLLYWLNWLYGSVSSKTWPINAYYLRPRGETPPQHGTERLHAHHAHP